MLQRWKLTIAYNGTGYSGWQRQENAPSVQQFIEEALYKFCQQEIRIHVAGRTDAGVHAQGQVAHFDLEYGSRDLTGFDLAKALNAHLKPQPIAIIHAEKTHADFHARFDATSKIYIYRIVCRSAPPVLEPQMVWHLRRPLNAHAMQEAASYLLGFHDFTTFRAAECQAKSPERSLDRLDIKKLAYDQYGGMEIQIHAQARSFLHHQMRNIAGTLALVGEEKWQPLDVKRALEARDRTKGGPTAPSSGLSLVHVFYPE